MQKTTSYLANPAPLGLVAFGMTTLLLNFCNTAIFPLSTVVVSMGIFYGGLAQIIAGLIAFKRGDIFPATAFVSYGFFWISLVGIWLLQPQGGIVATSAPFVGTYLLIWGIFTAFMCLGTCKAPFMLKFVFITLTILFMLLAIGDLFAQPRFTIIGGWVGLICGASAMYTGLAELLYEQSGKVKLPF